MIILMVDDHQIFRESVIDYLKKESFCSAIAGAASVLDAKRKIAERTPDILISDLSLPDEPGQDLLRWVAQEYPSVRRLVLTMHAELRVLREVLRCGAQGLVTKSSGYDELIEGMRRVAAGEYFLDQVMLEKVFQDLRGGSGGPRAASQPLALLTQREEEVFYALIKDKTLAEVADTLNVSAKTVENHRSNLYRKLGIHDRFSLFSFARDHGFLE